MSADYKPQTGPSKVLNKVKQSPGIPVDAWKDKSEKHYAEVIRKSLRDDKQDS
jgi:hypothetical protein